MVYFANRGAIARHCQDYEVVELVPWLSFRLECVVVEASHPQYLISIESVCCSVALEFTVSYVNSCIWQILRLYQIRYLFSLLSPFEVALDTNNTALIF